MVKYLVVFFAYFVLPYSAQAQDATWRYFTNESYVFYQGYPSLDEIEYKQLTLCVIEAWSPENSGFSRVSGNWEIKTVPYAPNGTDPILEIIETASLYLGNSSCAFFGIPWADVSVDNRQGITDLLKRQGITELLGNYRLINYEIPALKTPEEIVALGSSSASRISEAEAEMLAQEAGGNCRGNSIMSELYDCNCLINQAKQNLLDGRISVTDAQTLFHNSFYTPDAAGQTSCVNETGVRAYAMRLCITPTNSRCTASTEVQSCVADEAVRLFSENPYISKSRDIRKHMGDALLSRRCR